MHKALLVVVVVFLMIISMFAVASALPANIIPAKNGTSTTQQNGYYGSGLPTSSSNAQSSPLAKLSTNSGNNKLDSLLHSFNSPVESPTQPNLQGPYKVTFTETGLPTGMPWQVEVERSNFVIPPLVGIVYNMSFGIVNSSSGTSITFSLANGSYIYYTGPTSTYLGPYYFNVTGNPVSITFPFPAFYKVTFTESGLPSGMSWNVISVNNSSNVEIPFYYNITSSSSMVSYLPNGNYAFLAGPRSTYLMQKGFSVIGAALSLQAVFPTFYTVTFTEVNLHSGEPWILMANNTTSSTSYYVLYFNSSNTVSRIAYLPNGGYNYRAMESIFSGSSISGSFIVNNASETINVIFPVTYKVTFTEKNLPAGADWSVNVFNKNSSVSYYNTSSTSSMIAYLPNGTYNYSANFGSIMSPLKEFNVTGLPLSFTVIFPVTYKVTFTEKNLPAGAKWSVNAFNNNYSVSYYNFSTGSSMIAYLPNGTYKYSGNFNGVSTPWQEFNVTALPLSFTVIFPVTYKVTFTEKNLPAGADWSVIAFNNSYSVNYNNFSTGSSMIAYLPYGTYNYTGNFNGVTTPLHEFNVTGLPLSVTVIFPLTYKVTFMEKNIPAGAEWTVNAFNNSHSVSYQNTSFASSMIAYLPYGTYNYTAGNLNGITTPLHEFNVTGVSITINVVFPGKYSVVFTETGLPTGTAWDVSVYNSTTGYSSNSSSTSTITLSLYNGSYTYTVATSLSGWKPSSPSGTFIVPGSTVNVPTVTFSTTDHNVKFKESGMPTGTSWYVIFNATEETSTSNNITFYVPNGSYTYTLQTPVPGSTGTRYVVSPSSGNVSVSGYNLSENVSYSIQYYLTIYTSPAGTGTVSQSSGWFSAGSSVNLTAQADSGYVFSSWSGSGTGSYTGTNNPLTLTMSGPISETANFVQTSVSHYTVTFTESGLPSGTTWYVNLSNGFDSGAITGSSYSFSLNNGTYSYTIATTDKTYEPSPSTGSFIVNAGPVSKSVSFSEVKYTVTFTETGLPSGSSWNITFNGVTYSSANSIITLSAPNGTYSFSASNSSSYYTVNYSGSVSVKGNGVSTSIIYYHYAYISGTVNPHNATVDINGHSVKVTGSGSFNVSEASGTHSIVVSESGYSTYYSNVTLTAGQTKELNVTLNPVKSTPATPSIPPLELYGIVGAMVAIVAVVAVASLMRKKH